MLNARRTRIQRSATEFNFLFNSLREIFSYRRLIKFMITNNAPNLGNLDSGRSSSGQCFVPAAFQEKRGKFLTPRILDILKYVSEREFCLEYAGYNISLIESSSRSSDPRVSIYEMDEKYCKRGSHISKQKDSTLYFLILYIV